IGVMQEVPNAAKRQAREEVADAAIARVEAERKLVQLTIRRETALAWLNRYHLERKQALFDELDQQNRLLAEAVRAQVAGGRGTAADAIAPRQEAVMLAERRDELARDLAISKSALRRWLGAAGDEPLLGEPPSYPIDGTHLQHRLDLHPELAVFSPMAAMARAEVKEAEAGRRPDWGVEFAYQHRAPQYGDMVSVQFSFDLPIFQSTRQSPQIAAKQAELARIDAEREAMLREHRQTLEADLAEYARLDRAADRQAKEIIPLAQQKAELQMDGYRTSKVALTEVIVARRELTETRLRQIDLESQRAQLAARLHFAFGEDQQ
ncbi:TolC family protein, partial [Chitinimonas sp.]|uniref:TolC family protein n=1 Tax=Chitinimonas sp. TaxID=1934313 RepID=UPI0035AFA4CF